MSSAHAKPAGEVSTILLVEDEPVLRTSIARGLAKLPNVEILTAASYDEALALLESQPPALIISDIDLAGNSGLDLVGELARRNQRKTPLIFVTGYLRNYRGQIPDLPNLEVIEKPVPIADLRSKVTELLGPRGSLTPPPFSIADYVQLACLGRHSVRIELEQPSGSAYVVIHEGEVWTAVDSGGNGPEAFARIAFGSTGVITLSALTGDPGPRTIEARWEVLAMESARAFDEWGRDHAGDFADHSSLAEFRARSVSTLEPPVPAQVDGVSVLSQRGARAGTPKVTPAAPPPPVRRNGPPPVPVTARRERSTPIAAAPPLPRAVSAVPARGASFEDLWTKGVDALLNREFARAVEAFSAANQLRPNEPRVLANLQRLGEMGYAEDGLKDEKKPR